ncbi:MAG: LysE family transporter [Gammaproteobacteria bacterium]
MLLSTWITFVIAGALIAISPGSGAVLSMTHGLAYGFRKASATVLGLQIGLLLVLVIAGAGVGSLLVASELAFNVVKVVGALYLVYLGIGQWRSRAAPITNGVEKTRAPSFGRRVLAGFLTNATNPKGILFMVAVLPGFIDQRAPLLPQLAILGATMITIDTTVMHGYALLAASMQRVFHRPGAVRALNHFFGAVLVLIGVGLLFVKRAGAV